MTANWTAKARVHGVLADPRRLSVLHQVALGDKSPRQLSDSLEIPMPLLSHHLKVLADCGLIVRTPSEHDGRQHFITLHDSAFGYLDRQWLREHIATPSGRVVFACTHNSARSVLAAALWSDRYHLPTAAGGTAPGSRIHPTTLRTARSRKLRLLQDSPIALHDILEESDLLITVCDAANAQVKSHPNRLHWSIPDPARDSTARSFDDAFGLISQRIDRLGLALSTAIEEKQ